MKKVLTVPDMSCEHCKAKIVKALEAIDGVSTNVDLKNKTVTVAMEQMMDDQVLRGAVEQAGYDVASISQK